MLGVKQLVTVCPSVVVIIVGTKIARSEDNNYYYRHLPVDEL